MKKIGLTLTLAAILAVGSTQAFANGGIVISGLSGAPTQCEQTTSNNNNSGSGSGSGNGGIVISGLNGSSCQEEEKSIIEIILNSFGIVISG